MCWTECTDFSDTKIELVMYYTNRHLNFWECKPIQPHLKEYPKHSEGTSINTNALNILSNVMECSALLVDTLHQLLMAMQTMHL